jgi:hypothetical protein
MNHSQFLDDFFTNYDLFVNEVMCRREKSQWKADEIFDRKIKPYIDPEIAKSIQVEKSHYLLNQLDPNQFGTFLREMKMELMRDLNGETSRSVFI